MERIKVKWFQLAVIAACAILMGLLVGSVLMAYQRRAGSTGVDAGDIQQIREAMRSHKDS